jgi:hypothetical protein
LVRQSDAAAAHALGHALGFHGPVDEAVAEIVVDEVGQSITRENRSGGLIVFAPNDSPFPRPGEQPYFDSPVPAAIRVAERLRAEAAEQTRNFISVFSFLLTLMESGTRDPRVQTNALPR